MLTLREYPVFGRSRVWNELVNDTLSHVVNGTEKDWKTRSWSPAVDIYETADALVFETELPGFERDQIDINVEEGSLSVTAERKGDERSENSFQRRERFYGKLHRSFRLPPFADADRISASLKNGVLTVTVPKREEALPRQIKVEG